MRAKLIERVKSCISYNHILVDNFFLVLINVNITFQKILLVNFFQPVKQQFTLTDLSYKKLLSFWSHDNMSRVAKNVILLKAALQIS